MDIYKNLVEAVEKALEELTKEDREDKRINGKDIQKWVKDNAREFEFDVNDLLASWGAYLTRATADPNNRIAREPGKYSFILRDKEKDTEVPGILENEENANVKVEESRDQSGNQKRENILYDLFVEWLQSRGYKADITAMRKTGGRWGNPDVTGLLLIEDPFGRQELEIGTIEVKVSDSDWKKDFFEAVSHKRFSHRAYFAFPVLSDEPSIEQIKGYEELRNYGEKYNVGILVLFLPEQDYNTLNNGHASQLDLSLGDVLVQEIWPAVYEEVSPIETTNFVRTVLGLDSTTKINSFGTSS